MGSGVGVHGSSVHGGGGALGLGGGPQHHAEAPRQNTINDLLALVGGGPSMMAGTPTALSGKKDEEAQAGRLSDNGGIGGRVLQLVFGENEVVPTV